MNDGYLRLIGREIFLLKIYFSFVQEKYERYLIAICIFLSFALPCVCANSAHPSSNAVPFFEFRSRASLFELVVKTSSTREARRVNTTVMASAGFGLLCFAIIR